MPLEHRVQIKDLEGNPHCKNCWGKGYVYRTANGKRDPIQCGCAKARKIIVRAVA